MKKMDKDEIEEMERELYKILDECEEKEYVSNGDDEIGIDIMNKSKAIMGISIYIQENFKRRKVV